MRVHTAYTMCCYAPVPKRAAAVLAVLCSARFFKKCVEPAEGREACALHLAPSCGVMDVDITILALGTRQNVAAEEHSAPTADMAAQGQGAKEDGPRGTAEPKGRYG